MLKQYNFILVDDSLLDLFIHKKLISVSGISRSIITLNSGEEALQHLIDHEAAFEETIILLDLQMPEMNGFEFIEAYSTLNPSLRAKIRVFILSSTVDHGDIKRVVESPFIEGMISKPVDVAKLKIKLEAAS